MVLCLTCVYKGRKGDFLKWRKKFYALITAMHILHDAYNAVSLYFKVRTVAQRTIFEFKIHLHVLWNVVVCSKLLVWDTVQSILFSFFFLAKKLLCRARVIDLRHALMACRSVLFAITFWIEFWVVQSFATK